MSVRWPLHRKIGIGIILIGIAPVVYSLARMFSHNWEPLSVPVKLVPNEFQSPEFKTDIKNGRYLVELTFSKLPDLRRERCEIGIPLTDCDSIGQNIDFDWQVVSKDGETVRKGQYKVASYSDTEVSFGEFHATRANRWKVILKIRRDAGELNSANPKLVVETGGEYWETIPDVYGYSLLWAKYVASFGVIWMLVPILLQAVSRRKIGS